LIFKLPLESNLFKQENIKKNLFRPHFGPKIHAGPIPFPFIFCSHSQAHLAFGPIEACGIFFFLRTARAQGTPPLFDVGTIAVV
jgi:hypothetical protein